MSISQDRCTCGLRSRRRRRRRLSNTAAGRACRGRPPRPALEGEVIDDQRGSTGGGTEKLLVQPPEGERHRRGQK